MLLGRSERRWARKFITFFGVKQRVGYTMKDLISFLTILKFRLAFEWSLTVILTNSILQYQSIQRFVVVANLSSCHRTASYACYNWMILTLFFAITNCVWTNPHSNLLKSLQWSNVLLWISTVIQESTLNFLEFLSTEFAACSKPPKQIWSS